MVFLVISHLAFKNQKKLSSSRKHFQNSMVL